MSAANSSRCRTCPQGRYAPSPDGLCYLTEAFECFKNRPFMRKIRAAWFSLQNQINTPCMNCNRVMQFLDQVTVVEQVCNQSSHLRLSFWYVTGLVCPAGTWSTPRSSSCNECPTGRWSHDGWRDTWATFGRMPQYSVPKTGWLADYRCKKNRSLKNS